MYHIVAKAEEIEPLLAEGYKIREIAERVGVSFEGLRGYVKRRHPKRKTSTRGPSIDAASIDKLVAQGMNNRAIAHELSINYHTVNSYVRRTHGHRDSRGNAGAIKRARDDARVHPMLRAALATFRDAELFKMKVEHLAKVSGYSPNTVQCWVNGRRNPTGLAMLDLLQVLGCEIEVKRVKPCLLLVE